MQISRILNRIIVTRLERPSTSTRFQVNSSCRYSTRGMSTNSTSGDSSYPMLQQILNEYGRSDIVKIQNKTNIESLLTKIAQDGSTKLQVVTDFDQTVTRHHLNREICDMCHGILAYSPEMPQDFRDKTAVLFQKYYPIEISAELTEEEKLPYMIEWYEKSHELIVSTGLRKGFLRQLVAHSKCFLRDNAAATFKILREHNVPVLIFSGGLGDLLEIVLENNGILSSNIKVISNYMEFDSSEKICGFRPPLVHTLNKNETALFKNNNYFMDLAHRGNALLMGDNLGDSEMCTGMKNSVSILKIGFLNEKIEERLPSFLDAFDIVLCDDQSMDFVNLLLKHIFK